ncbi:MAG TPA: alpha/beta hydrolase [Actinomycetales bacterium]|nr:alpha/beta hydrolase [Actinomycetales bacterium]
MSMAETSFETEVDGGRVVVHELAKGVPGGPTVVAAHGITANALMWQPLADALARRRPDVRVLAPDLRGRADSRDVGGPRGLAAHAADLLVLVRSLGTRPLLVGHSMGAFVTGLAAATDPAAVSGVVLVDGGLAFPTPPDLDVDAALQAVIGPAMERLSLRFDDLDAYVAFWQRHPALGPLLDGPAGGAVRRYLAHDLVRSDDAWVSSCRLDVVRADGADVLADAQTHAAVGHAVAAGVPVELVWAARGLLDEPQGLYDEGRLAALAVPADVRVTGVDGNHYSVVLTDPGVSAVLDAVERLLPAAE